MPMPSVLPTPLPPRESRRPAPLEAQEASYLAASARMASLSVSSIRLRSPPAVSAFETAGSRRLTVQQRAGRRYSEVRRTYTGSPGGTGSATVLDTGAVVTGGVV